MALKYEKVSQKGDPSPPYCFYEILIQKFDRISGTYVLGRVEKSKNGIKSYGYCFLGGF